MSPVPKPGGPHPSARHIFWTAPPMAPPVRMGPRRPARSKVRAARRRRREPHRDHKAIKPNDAGAGAGKPGGGGTRPDDGHSENGQIACAQTVRALRNSRPGSSGDCDAGPSGAGRTLKKKRRLHAVGGTWIRHWHARARPCRCCRLHRRVVPTTRLPAAASLKGAAARKR